MNCLIHPVCRKVLKKYTNKFIDKNSLEKLKGSEVDFASELIGESFKISNTQTKSSCGCGVSFSF